MNQTLLVMATGGQFTLHCREADGKVAVGEIKEKEKAKVEYEDARQMGRSAGHVAHR